MVFFRVPCTVSVWPCSVPPLCNRAVSAGRLSTRRLTSRIDISLMQVWRTLRDEYLYPYNDPTVKHLEPGDHAQRMGLWHWIKDHPEVLSVILFSDEASFTPDGVNNSRNVHT